MKRRNYLRRMLMIFFVMLLAVFSATAVSASADENKDTEALAEAAEQETEIVVSGEGENPETPAPEYELSRAVLSGEVLSYTGSERVKESVAVFGNVTEQGETTEAELLEGTDYVLEYTDNLHAGTAVLTIRGIGHYDGKTLTETFEILQAGISGIELPSKKFEYTGAPITPEIKVFAFIADEWILLSGGSDYDVAYGGDNIHVGSVDITVTGKGDYKGYSGEASFRIDLKKAALASVKATGDSQIKVTWRKDTQADGYQIEYSTRKSFGSGTKNKVVRNGNKTTEDLNWLVNGKKYYVRVRSYKKVGSRNRYSEWSTVRNATVKE